MNLTTLHINGLEVELEFYKFEMTFFISEENSNRYLARFNLEYSDIISNIKFLVMDELNTNKTVKSVANKCISAAIEDAISKKYDTTHEINSETFYKLKSLGLDTNVDIINEIRNNIH